MIIRARPRFMTDNADDERLYFTSGAAAVTFFLQLWGEYVGHKLKVGIQTFTCPTMAEAVLATGAELHVFDISLVDLGLHLAEIRKEPLDVLILTTYQGIPSNEYEEISTYCRENNIIMFEDLAHGCMSRSAGGHQLGTLGNVYMESYCWDKPFAVMFGGSLEWRNLDKEFIRKLQFHYENLPCESELSAETDFRNICRLWEYSTQEKYRLDMTEANFLRHPFLYGAYFSHFFNVGIYRKVLSCFSRLLNHIKGIDATRREICRMHPIKIALVEGQRRNYQAFSEAGELTTFFRQLGRMLKIEEKLCFFEDEGIHWNRYSFLDMTGSIATYLHSHGVAAGNFNWSRCLHEVMPNAQGCVWHGPFKNAEIASKHIVNVPVWNNWWRSIYK